MDSVFNMLNMDEIIFFSCGSHFCICVCKNEVFSWGSNYNGQLGIGNQDNQSSPQQISFFKNIEEIISLCCGYDFCICVCTNGVFSWGNNNFGQLGIGNKICQSSPQQISFFKNTEEIISISCGHYFSICICKNGVFSWGDNYYGQLGIENDYTQYSLQKILFFQNSEEIISLSCGDYFCVCICTNGVFSWGSNCHGQLGIGTKIHRSSPQQITFFENPEEIIFLSCGGSFSICVCKNGVFSWGYNGYGQLGIGNKINQYSPQQILFFENPELIISLFCGSNFSICICKNGIFSLGYNGYRQLQLEIENNHNHSFPYPIFTQEKIESFYNLSFPLSYIDQKRKEKIILLILEREYSNPDDSLFGKYYLPRDLFKTLLNLVSHKKNIL